MITSKSPKGDLKDADAHTAVISTNGRNLKENLAGFLASLEMTAVRHIDTYIETQ